jgi:hypothetical protein
MDLDGVGVGWLCCPQLPCPSSEDRLWKWSLRKMMSSNGVTRGGFAPSAPLFEFRALGLHSHCLLEAKVSSLGKVCLALNKHYRSKLKLLTVKRS